MRRCLAKRKGSSHTTRAACCGVGRDRGERLGGSCVAKLTELLETYSGEKRATRDFSKGAEKPAEETEALALGYFDASEIPENRDRAPCS